MTNKDPLATLLVDADDIDRATLADLLKGFVLIDKKEGRLVFQAGFDGLDASGKIVKFLLATKARSLLTDAEDGASAKEIIESTGLASGTAHPKLRELLKAKVINQASDKSYYVPAWSLAAMPTKKAS